MKSSPAFSAPSHRLLVGYADHYDLELPAGHRFPYSKYTLLREQLIRSAILEPSQLFDPAFLPEEAILRAHTATYWAGLKRLTLPPAMQRRIGLPLTDKLLQRAWASASITYHAAQAALLTGAGANLGGGTHHAYPDKGEGFCVLNDIGISALDLLAEGKIQRTLVVDLDVHQGNGTAVMLQHEPRVFTFSMHCAQNYPSPKEKSDLDIELPAGTGDAAYLQQLEEVLPRLIHTQLPDILYYIAGADVLGGDRLGRLQLTPEGMAARDAFVISICHRLGIPIVLTLGGGYNENLARMINAQARTIELLAQTYD